MKSFTTLCTAAVIGAFLMLWTAPLPATAPDDGLRELIDGDGIGSGDLMIHHEHHPEYFGDYCHRTVTVNDGDAMSVEHLYTIVLDPKRDGKKVYHGYFTIYRFNPLLPRMADTNLESHRITHAKFKRCSKDDTSCALKLKLTVWGSPDTYPPAKGTLLCHGPLYDESYTCNGELFEKHRHDDDDDDDDVGVDAHRVIYRFGNKDPEIKDEGAGIRKVCSFF